MRYMFVLMLVMGIAILPAIVVNHISPATFETDLTTEIRIEVIQGVSYISETYLMYRPETYGDFSSVLMEHEVQDSLWISGYLPVTTAPTRGYEYYFKFQMIDGSVETLPVSEPEKNAYLIQPNIKTGDLSKEIILLNSEGKVRSSDGLVIAVSWLALEELIDNRTVNLIVNGKNVTQKAYIGSSMLLYRDATPKAGLTSYFVTAKTKDGKEFHSNTWTSDVIATGNPFNLPMNMKGTFRTGTNVYATAHDSTSTFGNDRDDGWADLEMLGYYKDLKLQAYSHLSTLQNSNIQNVNRFRMGIILPFWDTYFGDYSPYLTNLTMSNKNIRGIFTKLHSKNVAFTFTHGEILRTVESNEYLSPVTRDTIYVPGVFKQETIAARIQLGPDNGFYVGMTTTRNRDVISSLDSLDIFINESSGAVQRAFPKDNLVLSMDARLTIPKYNFVLGWEGAGSLFNANTYPGPFTQEDLSEYLDSTNVSINPADFQDIFVINTNMQPIPMSDKFPNPKSFLAWQVYLRNYLKNNMLNVSYSETGPSYRALSTTNTQRDVTQWQVSDQFTYRQFLFLGGGLSQNKDNMYKSKLETNIYNNFYIQGMVRIQQYPYLLASFTDSYSKNERNAEISALTDSTTEYSPYSPYKRNSRVYSFTLGYEFNNLPIAPSTVDFSWRTGNDYDKRQEPSKLLVKEYNYLTNNFSLGVRSRFKAIPLRTQFTLSNGKQDNTVSDITNSNINFVLKGEYWFWKNRIKPWIEYNTSILCGDQDSQAYNNIGFGVEANPFDYTTVSTSLGWRIYNNDDANNADYTTTAWHLVVAQRF
jgi:hypothetical protein